MEPNIGQTKVYQRPYIDLELRRCMAGVLDTGHVPIVEIIPPTNVGVCLKRQLTSTLWIKDDVDRFKTLCGFGIQMCVWGAEI